MNQHDLAIERTLKVMLRTNSPQTRRVACDVFTAAIRQRNAERSPQEIAELERAKGLRR